MQTVTQNPFKDDGIRRYVLNAPEKWHWIACEYNAVTLCGQSEDFRALWKTICRSHWRTDNERQKLRCNSTDLLLLTANLIFVYFRVQDFVSIPDDIRDWNNHQSSLLSMIITIIQIVLDWKTFFFPFSNEWMNVYCPYIVRNCVQLIAMHCYCD